MFMTEEQTVFGGSIPAAVILVPTALFSPIVGGLPGKACP
jgi:hypothetical protein